MAVVWTEVVVVVICVVAAVAGQQECRVCPEGCQTVPRSDGSCPVCICDGVALTDCRPSPTECSEGCQVERGAEGCSECSCLRQDTTVCPSLGACPEECQQLIGGTGCPECVCEVPEPLCPAIECPEECTLVEQEDGCPSCRCDPPPVCPAIPECLRGCIDRDEERDCFFCNCALQPDQSLEGGLVQPESNSPSMPDQPPERSNNPSPPDERPSGVDEALLDDSDPADTEPLEPVRPEEDERPASDRRNSVSRCGNQRLQCGAGCRIGIAPNGCRECYCGANAMICPGVQRCNSRCQYRSPMNGCCRCQCARPLAFPGLRITWKRLASVSPRLFLTSGRLRG